LVDNNKPLAHYDDQTPLGGQLLTDHLMTVSEISGRTGEVIGMGSMSKLIGLLHDLGKCSRNFKHILEENIKRGLTILPPAQSSWIKWRRKFGQIMILIIFLSLDESAPIYGIYTGK
jgi:hypothetical protein